MVTLVVVLVGGPWSHAAAAEEPATEATTTSSTSTSTPTTSTSSTSTSTTSTSTTTAPPEPEQESTTTVVAPPPPSGPGPSGPPPPPPDPTPTLPDLAAPSGDDTAPPPDDSGFPAHLQALTDSVVRTGSSTTDDLVDALGPLLERGLSTEEVARVGFGRFPVAGRATYSHDWWFPRFGPSWRLHEGTDIFADTGTPVRAPVDGTVRISGGGLGGLAVYVTAADGTYFYLAHLAGTAPGLVEGATVATGDLVGFVGTSGNAQGGLPHVHFEVHPGGGEPVDPKPVLDRLLADAEAAVPYLLDADVATSAAATSALPQPGPFVIPESAWPSWEAASTPDPGVAATEPSAGGGGLLGRLALSAPLRPIAFIALKGAPDLTVLLVVLLAVATTFALVVPRRSRNKLDNDS